MRIKRLERGYTLFMTEHEFSILQMMKERFDIDAEWEGMTTGQKRSWSRRIRHGDFMRIDADTRKW